MVVLLLWPLAMAMTVPSPKDTDGGSREGEMGVKMSMGAHNPRPDEYLLY